MAGEGQLQVKPNPQGTGALLVACVVGYFLTFQDATPSRMLQLISFALLAGMGISFLLDWRLGLRNLLRVDVFALLSFYFLTYFEFLFPQGRFDMLVIPDDVVTAARLTLAGFATMVVGRHMSILPRKWLDPIGEIKMRPGHFLVLFFGATFLNFLPQLLAVDFNPVDWFQETLKPRFGKAWGRGQYGDLAALLHEFQLLGYVMPPIAGLIFARRKDYAFPALIIVGLCLLLLLWVAFSNGTRNVFAIQVASFFAAYFILQDRLRLKLVIPSIAVVGILFVVLADMMLEFRNIGLERYIEEKRYTASYEAIEKEYLPIDRSETASGYFVDYNLWRLSQIVAAIPGIYDFIGWNMPYVALTKPIPRALWPDKPLDFEVGLEEAIGAEGLTIAVTWVGEAYIAGGLLWIIPIGVLIGAFCGFWNELARFIRSPFALIVFASGFYAVLLLMRSLIFFTTALLPPIALIIMGFILYKSRQSA